MEGSRGPYFITPPQWELLPCVRNMQCVNFFCPLLSLFSHREATLDPVERGSWSSKIGWGWNLVDPSQEDTRKGPSRIAWSLFMIDWLQMILLSVVQTMIIGYWFLFLFFFLFFFFFFTFCCISNHDSGSGFGCASQKAEPRAHGAMHDGHRTPRSTIPRFPWDDSVA